MRVQTSMPRVAVMSAILMFALVSGSASAQAVDQLLDLGTLGGDASSGDFINDSGQIAGWSQRPGDPYYHAYSWTKSGGMVDLVASNPAVNNVAIESNVFGLNNAGEVFGHYTIYNPVVAGFESQAYVWTAATGLVVIGNLPGGTYSLIRGIGEEGMAAGRSGDKAFVWTRQGGLVDIGILPGADWMEVVSVSKAGHVIGFAGKLFGQPEYFLWTQAGGLVGIDCAAQDVNELGEITGTCGGDAFFRHINGDMVDLGATQSARGHYVNNSGQVAGLTQTGGFSAWFWSQAGGVAYPTGAQVVGSEATGLSDAGMMLGQAILLSSQTRAFVSQDGGPMQLLSLGGASSPRAIHTTSGQVLGESSIPQNFRGFSWTAADGVVEMPTYGIGDGYSASYAVNARGQVAGQSYDSTVGAGAHAVLWNTKPADVSSDQNGDLKSDVLFRNTASGANQLYLMDGAAISSNVVVSAVSPLWQAVGQGDYNGDGMTDILWRYTPTGSLWIYFMNGNAVSSSGFVSTIADSNWKIVGNGDYTGDGKSDILFHHAVNGTVWLFAMDANTVSMSSGVGTAPDTNWKIVGSGDYNGDGKSDVLWRHAVTGNNWIYLMNGATIATSVGIGVAPDLNWQIVGSGDYNGDGKSDVLWRHAASGNNWMYLMNGTTITSSASISVLPDLNWKVVGDGDYNGDGKSDVLWRNTATGANRMYLMDGLTITSNAAVSTVSDQNWQVVNVN